MEKMQHIWQAIDWISIKINIGAITLAAITGNGVLVVLTFIATLSTIVYNGIRIYKELKVKK